MYVLIKGDQFYTINMDWSPELNKARIWTTPNLAYARRSLLQPVYRETLEVRLFPRPDRT